MNIIVLGARGFLGQHVMDALCDAGHVGVMAPCEQVLDLSVEDPSDLVAAIDRTGASVVVNACGHARGPAALLAQSNVATVRTILEACRRAPGRVRLIHLGTAEEYGAVDPGLPIREDAPCRPVSAFGWSKVAATSLVLEAAKSGDVDAVVLRVFDALGARQPESSLAGQVARLLAVTEPLAPLRLSRLDSCHDFVDARDVGRAVVAAAETPFASGEVVNVGSGTAVLARTVVDGLARRAGHTGPVIESADGASWMSGVTWQQADIRLAGRVLDWRPSFSLDDALDEVWQSIGRR